MTTGKTIAIVLGAVFACAVLMIGLCGGLLYLGFKNADQAVSPRVDALFAAIEAGTFAETYETHTTQALREATSRKEYAELGNAVAVRLGALESKSLRGFKMRQHNADSFIEVTYVAEFEKGSGTIAAQLKQEGGQWKFVTFRVDSPVFDQDLATAECPACGEPHSAGARYCPSCGAELEPAEAAAEPADETASDAPRAAEPTDEADD